MVQATTLKDASGNDINPAKEDGNLEILQTTLLYSSTMAANGGDWTVTGTPDFTSGTYVRLTSEEELVSVVTYLYGVLSFIFRASDNIARMDGGGFALPGGVNEAQIFRDALRSAAQGTGTVSSVAFGMALNTWYKAKVIWCPTFVRGEIWTLAGAVVGAAYTHRNPPTTPLPLHFLARAGGINYDITGVNVQRISDTLYLE